MFGLVRWFCACLPAGLPQTSLRTYFVGHRARHRPPTFCTPMSGGARGRLGLAIDAAETKSSPAGLYGGSRVTGDWNEVDEAYDYLVKSFTPLPIEGRSCQTRAVRLPSWSTARVRRTPAPCSNWSRH